MLVELLLSFCYTSCYTTKEQELIIIFIKNITKKNKFNKIIFCYGTKMKIKIKSDIALARKTITPSFYYRMGPPFEYEIPQITMYMKNHSITFYIIYNNNKKKYTSIYTT